MRTRLLVCGCPSQFVRDCGHQEGCEKYGQKRCITCGSRIGIWTDDTTWTCLKCGDEWPA